MAGVLDAVDQRTKLVGQNRLELLLFRLETDQLYGINVFKVREVLQCPKLTMMPKRNPVVRGVSHIRGRTIPIIDLSLATRQSEIDDLETSFIIITEYNTKVQGFLVKAVDRIVNLNWQDVHLPPSGSGTDNYLTSVTEIDNKMVEILDVEKILSEVSPSDELAADELYESDVVEEAGKQDKRILIADDSSVARKQIQRCIEPLGVKIDTFKDGAEALHHLQALAEKGIKVSEYYTLVISDIEMPEMDGYTLTAEIRDDSRLAGLQILLHTSLSGIFNESMVAKVGADSFLAKYDPSKLAGYVSDCVKGEGTREQQVEKMARVEQARRVMKQ